MSFKANSIQKIGYVLKFYRRLKNLSQNDMAQLLEISHRNFQRIEAGTVEPKLETLGQISTLLRIPISALFFSNELNISDLSTQKEYKEFEKLTKSDLNSDSIFRYANNLIDEDKKNKTFSEHSNIEVIGDKAVLSPDLCHLVGLKKNTVNIDDHLLIGNCVDRWDYVFRNNIKNAVIENSLLFPKGLFVFEEYHFNTSANPDNPTSKCVVRDVTARFNLSSEMNILKSKKQRLN